jgi:hypothetical protein
MLAAVGFVAGVVISFLEGDATLEGRLLHGAIGAGLTFVAAVFLFCNDELKRRSERKAVGERLSGYPLVSDAELVAAIPHVDPVLLVQVRNSVAEFFSVPVEWVHPHDDLGKEMALDEVEPDFHSFVVFHVLAARKIGLANARQVSFRFDSACLLNLGDLWVEVQRVVDRLEAEARKYDAE